MYICIDIGGTDIKYGVMDVAGEFAVHGTLPTEAKTYGGLGIVRKVSDLVRGTCGV